PGGADVDDHVRQQAADELMVGERHPELPALRGVAAAGFEARLADAHGPPGNAVAPMLQGGGDDVREAEAGAPDQVAVRDVAVREGDLGELGGAGAPDSLKRLDGEPGGFPLDQEGGGLAFGASEHEEEARNLAEGRPLLAAVEHPAVAGSHGRGLDAGGVAAGVRLGEGQGGQHLGASEGRQEPLALPGAPPALDGVGDHVVHGQQRTHGGAAAADLLGEQTVGDHVAAHAAELFRDVRAEIPLSPQGLDPLGRDGRFPVPAIGVGQDLRRHEATKLIARRALPGRELEPHEPFLQAGAGALLRATRSEIAWMERKLSRSRSASSTWMSNSFSTKATSCMASSELTKPREKMSSSTFRSWLLKNRDRNSLILS